MATIILKIDEKSKAGKALKALIDILAGKPKSGVEIVDAEPQGMYNADFVKKVKQASASKVRTEINPQDVWGSLGLR